MTFFPFQFSYAATENSLIENFSCMLYQFGNALLFLLCQDNELFMNRCCVFFFFETRSQYVTLTYPECFTQTRLTFNT